MSTRTADTQARRHGTIRAIIERTMDRRAAGEQLGDQQVIAEHPDLAPELAEQLQLLGVLERVVPKSLAGEPATEPVSAPSPAAWSTQPSAGPSSGANDVIAGDLPEFPGYSTIRCIDRGGQGLVYEAIQDATQRRVAIKLMRDTALGVGLGIGDRENARFEREVRILGLLDHPNIVGVIGSGVTRSHAYIVMEYVDGTSLDQFVAAREPSIRDRVALMESTCRAVHAAHLRGVIHRDLKPGNVLVTDDGQPHVLDFGLAALTEEFVGGASVAHSITQTGQFLGTLAWASPEQGAGADAVDLRTDVYALGLLIFQALTGAMPYRTDGSMEATLRSIAGSPPARPSSLRKGIDTDLDTIILKCLSKHPDERYQSAEALAEDLRRYLSHRPIIARSPSVVRQVRSFVFRNSALVSGVGAGILALMLGLGATLRENTRARRAETDARNQLNTYERVNRFYGQVFRLADYTDNAGAAFYPGSSRTKELTLPDLLIDAADRAPKAFADRPDLAAGVAARIGRGLMTVKSNAECVRILETAFAAAKSSLGADARPTLELEGVLARAVNGTDPKERAWELARDALDRARNTLATGDPLLTELTLSARYQAAGSGDEARSAQLDLDCLHVIGEWVDGSQPAFLESLMYYSEAAIKDKKLARADSLLLVVLGLGRRMESPENFYAITSKHLLIATRLILHRFKMDSIESDADDLIKTIDAEDFPGDRVKKLVVNQLMKSGSAAAAVPFVEGMLASARREHAGDSARIAATEHLLDTARAAAEAAQHR